MPSGRTYALVDFIDRIIPKRGDVDAEFVRNVLGGLKRVSQVEEQNPRVTLTATVTAGVWILYRGRQRMLINPGQKYLRVEAAYRAPDLAKELITHFSGAVRADVVEKTDNGDYHQWRVPASSLELIWEFVEALPGPDPKETMADVSSFHPRYFSGEVRELALKAFEQDGRVCKGVSGNTVPHHVEAGGLIEFDHVLPYSRGGPSSLGNVQVLCADCNRVKSGSAW